MPDDDLKLGAALQQIKQGPSSSEYPELKLRDAPPPGKESSSDADPNPAPHVEESAAEPEKTEDESGQNADTCSSPRLNKGKLIQYAVLAGIAVLVIICLLMPGKTPAPHPVPPTAKDRKAAEGRQKISSGEKSAGADMQAPEKKKIEKTNINTATREEIARILTEGKVKKEVADEIAYSLITKRPFAKSADLKTIYPDDKKKTGIITKFFTVPPPPKKEKKGKGKPAEPPM